MDQTTRKTPQGKQTSVEKSILVVIGALAVTAFLVFLIVPNEITQSILITVAFIAVLALIIMSARRIGRKNWS